MPRPYLSNDHLWSTIESEAGAIAVLPVTAESMYFDIAWSNSMPANRPDGEHGSRVLNIGHGVTIRGTGHVQRYENGWEIRNLIARQVNGRELTHAQSKRAGDLITSMVLGWMSNHEGDVAQGDDIYRNNACRTLEENIERHTAALKILRRNLRACENGRDYAQYPDLPTDRR